MKNTNKLIIKKLSRRSMKNNHRRNFFAVVAIVLVCLLFTGTFTVADGTIKSVQREVMRQVGTSAHAGFKDITRKQYEKIITHPDIKEASYNIFFGIAANPELVKRNVELRYTQSRCFEYSMAKVLKGRLPKEGKEVMLDTLTLDALGISYELGKEVNLNFKLDNKEYKDSFILCGIYEGDVLGMASEAYFSKEYVENLLSIHTEGEWKEYDDRGLTNGIGLIQLSVEYKNSRNIEERTLKIIKECGFADNEIDYGINWAYIDNQSLDPLTVAVVAIIIIIVLLSGYLIISNIFYISIVGDIRFYGLLKTVGTTNGQLKKLIHRQADRLCLMGIPAGLISGWLFGAFLIPKFMNVIAEEAVIEVNPLIFIFSIIFTFFTVRAGCHKSGKMVKKISPVEAVRYAQTGRELSVRRKTKNSSKKRTFYKAAEQDRSTFHHFSPTRMAFKNIFREKKKAASVLLSMTLGMLLLLVIVTLLKSFSVEKYAANMMGNTDIIITSALKERMGAFVEETDVGESITGVKEYFSEKGIEDADIKGMVYGETYIKLLGKAYEAYKKLTGENFFESELSDPYGGEYLKESIDNILDGKAGMSLCLYSMDAELASRFEVLEGDFDPEKYNTGRYILLTKDAEEDGGIADMCNLGSLLYDIGDKVEIAGTEYEVMAFISVPYMVSVGQYSINSMIGVLPDGEFEGIRDILKTTYGISINVSDDREKLANELAAFYTENINPDLKYQSRQTMADQLMGLWGVVKLAGGALTLLVFLIALMNFINTTITGMLSRKTEFAMLESIGMEKRQKMYILYQEGLWQVLISGGISLVLGGLFCRFALKSFCESMSWLIYRFTAAPLLFGIVVFGLAGIIVPVLYLRSGKKETVVEALKNCE